MKNYRKLLTNLYLFNDITYKIVKNRIIIKTNRKKFDSPDFTYYLVLHINRLTHNITKVGALIMDDLDFEMYGKKVVSSSTPHIFTDADFVETKGHPGIEWGSR